MAIRIEYADAADTDSLVELLNLLFSIEQDFVPDEAAQRRGLALLFAHPEQGQIFVARDDSGYVIGMISAQLVMSTAIGAYSVWIEDVILRGPYRGQGVGKALLEKATEWAVSKGAKRIQLLGDADNLKARDLYRHLGWQPTRLFAWKQLLD